MKILVVDDHVPTQKLLATRLRSWGHDPLLTSNGHEAWKILESQRIGIVISDWNMPVLNGVELCQKVRAANFEQYVYIVLCTGRDEKSDLIAGLDAGADAFLKKPVDFDELRVALRGAQRVLDLESRLQDQNHKLNDAYTRLRGAYKTIEQDLKAAAELQRQLLPRSHAPLQNVNIRWFFSPAHFLAGDIFNFFPLGDRQLAFYHLDVSGHGTSAALLSVSLSRTFSDAAASRTALFDQEGTPRSPHLVLQQFNERFQNIGDMYFTMIYGIIDGAKHTLTFSQGGHPNPICLTAEGEGGPVGGGGFPIGMIAPMTYERTCIPFDPGNRLFLYSDGITECTNGAGEAFGEALLLNLLKASVSQTLADQVEHVKEAVWAWRGSDEFEDDLSLLAFQAL